MNQIMKEINNTINDLFDYQSENTCTFVNDVYSSRRVIELAKELEKEEETRIKKLKENGPAVHINSEGEITITLLRNNKEVFRIFGDWFIDVDCTQDEDIIYRYMIDGPKDDDGFTYFIHVKPLDIPEYGVYITKEEATILQERIKDVEEQYLRGLPA